MSQVKREFIRFGEWLPDRKLLANEGLLRAYHVIPFAGNYISAPYIEDLGPEVSEEPFGLGIHTTIASGEQKTYGYFGSETKIFEMNVAAATSTNRSRATGYAFAASPPGASEMWWFTSYADNVVATNFEDEVQYQATRGTAFADMITSTFKPQARFAFPIRQNLFLAYCFLPSTYDGLASGTHPWLVAWSQNDNIRSFGSENVDPALIGAGYQTLGNDLGPITAAIGGDYGLIFQTKGITRIDGPPYEFRTVAEGDTTLYPYSVFRLNGDVYFWGSGGPSVLRGGNGPVERLGDRKINRSLFDTTTGFGDEFAKDGSAGARDISGAGDPINRLCRWSYAARAGGYLLGEAVFGTQEPTTIYLDCNTDGTLFAASPAPAWQSGAGFWDAAASKFLRSSGAEHSWGPFNAVYGIHSVDNGASTSHLFVRFAFNEFNAGAGGFVSYMKAEFRSGFFQFAEGAATRVIAVRPVVTKRSALTDTNFEAEISVRAYTKNKPWEAETEKGPFTTANDDGWIGTDDAAVGSYHSIQFKMTSDGEDIHEFEGIEVQFVTAGSYGNA